MKKLIFVFLILILAACKSQNQYSDFDYSYTRSGGKLMVYENLLIKGNNAHYSLQRPGKKYKKDFKISQNELDRLQTIIAQNNFRLIQEDYIKSYDRVSTSITVKNGENSGRKSNAGSIMQKDEKSWQNITEAFQAIIQSNTANPAP